MMDESLKILDELLQENLQDQHKIEKELAEKQERLQEIDAFLNSMKDDADFKVFSPRTAESLHREEIASNREEREELLGVYDKISNQLFQTKARIEKLSYLNKEYKNTINNLQISILDMQEKERARIARELHDTSIQNLTHLVHSLELASLYMDKDPVQAKLELATCSQNLKKSIDEIRDTVFDLRPMSFDDLGFNQCITNLIDVLKKQYKDIAFQVTMEDLPAEEYFPDAEHYRLFYLTLYRIIHEALLNAVKHSEASKVELRLQRNNEGNLLVKIVDNGKGFIKEDTNDKHFGISIMKERTYLLGGYFEMNAKENEGTRIFLSFPFISVE